MIKLILAACCIGLLSACTRHEEPKQPVEIERVESFFACTQPDRLNKKDPEFKRTDGKIVRYNFCVKKGDYPPPECECVYLGDGRVFRVQGVLQ